MCPWSRTQVCHVTSRRHNAHYIHTVCTRVPMTRRLVSRLQYHMPGKWHPVLPQLAYHRPLSSSWLWQGPVHHAPNKKGQDTYICTYVRMHAHTHIHSSRFRLAKETLSINISAAYSCLLQCIYTYVHTYINTYTHTYIHKYIYIYILIYYAYRL